MNTKSNINEKPLCHYVTSPLNKGSNIRPMKDSGIQWIGQIPEDWEAIPIKYLASYNDDVLSETTDPDYEFEYIEIGSVEYGKGITQTEKLKFEKAPSRARRVVKKDDVIISTVRTYLRAIATIGDSSIQQVVSTGFIVIRAKNILPSFLKHAVLSEPFICKVESHSNGISYPAINSSEIVKFKVPLPPLAEQQAIANFLDQKCSAIDSVLEKTKASIEEYKKLKQSVITQAVTKGIRPNRQMKDSGIEWIGQIPEDWKCKKLKFFCKVFGRIGFRGYTTEDLVDEGEGAISLSPSNIKNGKLDYSKKTFISWFKYNESPEIMVKNGDVLMVKTGSSYGKASLVTNLPLESTINPQLVVFKEHIENASYLAYCFQTQFIQAQVELSVVGGTIPTIAQEKILNYYLPCPTLSEQQTIADYLDDKCTELDNLIAKKEQFLKEIETYKKSLIYEYVTGKKEVL